MRYAALAKCSLSSLLFALLVCSGTAHAGIILGAGDSLSINVDLSSESPAPPYDRVNITLVNAITTPGIGTLELFNELNSVSPFTTLSNASTSTLAGGSMNGAGGFTDGIFSFTYSIVSGTLGFDAITATALIESGGDLEPLFTTTILTPTNETVPVPATLALLGLGLLGLARRRRA